MGATGINVPMPHTLGADGAGVVVEVGAQSGSVKVGDAVCLYPPTGCGRCEFCITDQDFMCVYLRVLGERMEGTYAEYVKLPAQNCFPIPQGYSFEVSAAEWPARPCNWQKKSARGSSSRQAVMRN